MNNTSISQSEEPQPLRESWTTPILFDLSMTQTESGNLKGGTEGVRTPGFDFVYAGPGTS